MSRLGLRSVCMAFSRDCVGCESASNLDPWRIRYNALQLNAFRQKSRGHGWTPIEHAWNTKFHFWFNDLVLKRGGVQVARRFTFLSSDWGLAGRRLDPR